MNYWKELNTVYKQGPHKFHLYLIILKFLHWKFLHCLKQNYTLTYLPILTITLKKIVSIWKCEINHWNKINLSKQISNWEQQTPYVRQWLSLLAVFQVLLLLLKIISGDAGPAWHRKSSIKSQTILNCFDILEVTNGKIWDSVIPLRHQKCQIW